MSLRHAFIDIFKALNELRGDLLLVADTQILQVEGRGMTGIGTHLRPFVGSGVAIGPLDKVDSLSHPLVHLRHRHDILSLGRPHVPTAIGSLTAHTSGQDGYGLHAEVLAELEVLEVAETTTLVITPGVLQLTTCLLRTDGGLPTIGVPETVATAVNHTSAGEAHELRLEVGQGLGEILAQTMSLIGVLGYQRHHVDIHITRIKYENLERSFLTGAVRRQHGLVFLPGIVGDVDDSLCQQLRILGRPSRQLLDKHNTHLLGVAIDIAQEGGEIILLACLHGDAVPTVVLDAEALPTLIVKILLDTFGVEAQVGGVVGMDGVVVADEDVTQRVTWANLLPGCACAPAVTI